jgi:cobalt-zinc-cadmium efflux system protein
VNILLESVPAHLDIDTVASEIGTVKGVREAYHLHVWTITSGVYAMSAHVLIDDQPISGSRNIIDEIKALLLKKFNITHSTIQLECDRCESGLVCNLPNTMRKGN